MKIRAGVVALGVFALFLVPPAPARADEGMWMPRQMPELSSRLAALGFDGNPRIFADLTSHPMGAVVSLGGCSASFVSPDGLLVTNHHCVQGALQYNSTPERNLIEDGFVAQSRDEELWNGPGSRVAVTVSVREVTDTVTGGLDPKLTDRQRTAEIESRTKKLVAACETSGLRCQVSSFFEGLRWYELAQMEVEDVRLVWAPPAGIGNFGGEVDNWQWPRHTGDFSMYRAYVGKDGKPAAYSKDNVPYAPKHWLKVSTKGVSAGELILVAGYPGRTFRHEAFDEVKERIEWQLPRSIRRAKEQLAIIDELAKDSKEIAIKAEPRKRGLANGMKKNTGVLSGFLRLGLLGRKEADERELEAWIASDPARAKEFGRVLPDIRRLLADERRTRERDAVLGALYSPSLFSAAGTLHRLSIEKTKRDADRDPDYQERNWKRRRESLERMQKSFDPKLDRALFRYVLLEAAALPAGERIEPLDRAIGFAAGQDAATVAAKLDAWLDGMYGKTKLGNREFRLGLFGKSTKELLGTADPFLQLAAELYPVAEAKREADKTFEGARSRLFPRYMEVHLAEHGGLIAPDANGTLRVTFGEVRGSNPRDGVAYLPQTTLQGVADKHVPGGDFEVPARELEAIRALRAGKGSPFVDPKLGDVPVAFLSDVDTTGGNSGSAALNGKGELVGLLFDGTYESVASDYMFDHDSTRSIQVDVRYLLWVLKEVDGATNLLEEMGIR